MADNADLVVEAVTKEEANKRSILRVATAAVVCVVAFLLPLAVHGAYSLHVLFMLCINVIVATSLRLVVTTGQVSLAQGAMMTIGGYASALLCMKAGVSPWLAPLLGGVVTALFAAVTGFAFTRLRGTYFALATLFLAQVVLLLVQDWRDLTGGTGGLFGIPRAVGLSSSVAFYYLVLGLLVITLGVLYAIERSRVGQIFNGIRQSDSVLESVGINTAAYKVLAFAIGAFFPGIAGGIYSQYMQTLNPGAFGFLFSVYALIYVVVGGRRKFVGPIVGAIVLTLLPQLLRPIAQYQPLIFAVILMAVIFVMPEGLVGLPTRVLRLRRRDSKEGGKYAAGS